MNKLLDFIQTIFMIKKEDNIKIGLTQFKKLQQTPPPKKDVSIRAKNVKLSDLMRRVS